MEVPCVWEHNGQDTLLYLRDHPGAYTRGASLGEALAKVNGELRAYVRWRDGRFPDETAHPWVAQEKASALRVADADSDVLFDIEKPPLTPAAYEALRALALKSAESFQALYDAVPHKGKSALQQRPTFYGPMPRTAAEMYAHTRGVNAYYFGEIGVAADGEGPLAACRRRGFESLEKQPGFLENPVFVGSYDEAWSLRKVLRRFLWHDRIHARALWRMARKTFEGFETNPFYFE